MLHPLKNPKPTLFMKPTGTGGVFVGKYFRREINPMETKGYVGSTAQTADEQWGFVQYLPQVLIWRGEIRRIIINLQSK